MNGDGSRRPSSVRPGVGVHQQAGAARLEQELPAAAAGQERLAVPGDHADRGERPAAGRVQRGDQAAFGAQGEPVGRVLHVAAGHDPAVGGLARRSHPQPRVRRVGPLRRLGRGRPQCGPVDRHVRTSRACENSVQPVAKRAGFPGPAGARGPRGALAVISIWQRPCLLTARELPPDARPGLACGTSQSGAVGSASPAALRVGGGYRRTRGRDSPPGTGGDSRPGRGGNRESKTRPGRRGTGRCWLCSPPAVRQQRRRQSSSSSHPARRPPPPRSRRCMVSDTGTHQRQVVQPVRLRGRHPGGRGQRRQDHRPVPAVGLADPTTRRTSPRSSTRSAGSSSPSAS